MDDGTITTKQLAEKLNRSEAKIHSYRKAGMPIAGKQGRSFVYFECDVVKWLIDNGYARPKSKPMIGIVYETIADVANHYDVHRRTINDWLKEDGFPGVSSGRGGSPPGFFPVDEINVWLANKPTAKVGPDGAKNYSGSSIHAERSRLTSIKASKAEIELSQQKGELIEVASVTMIIIDQVNAIKEMLSQVPGEVEIRLPSTIKKKERKVIRDVLKKVFDNVFFDLAELHQKVLSEDEDDD